MKKKILALASMLALSVAGYAGAAVVISGDSSGTVTPGQALTVYVADSLSGGAPGAPYGWCDPSAFNVASGSFSVGPIGSASGTGTLPLSISCADTGYLTGTWTYTGSVVVTVPQDAPSSLQLTVSVAVQEKVPVQLASDSGCDCYSNNNYTSNQTYTVVPATTSTSTETSTAETTTTAPATTSTAAVTTTTATTTAPSTGTKTTGAVKAPGVGHTMLIARRNQTTHCTRGVLPDRQCSPGAFYSGLTKAVLCSSTFHTGSIRNVPDSEKHQVEIEYGMKPKAYGRTIEIDHIISLELGGSNDIANLYPEPGSGKASYHVKDKLENKLHKLVCAGSMTLHAAQAGIARNWETLYKTVFGVAP